MTRPLRVAVVGAGPAGMYAAGHLLEGPGGTYLDGRTVRLVDRPIEVDVLDRLPTPWGLVRYGVAPDHPEKKLVERVFAETARRPGFRFFGNVTVGQNVSVAELTQWYDAVVYAIGADSDPRSELPGAELPGSLAAREFVAWYSGHPDYRDLPVDLSHPRVVIIGNGNVALDTARILLTAPDRLARTDIAEHALEALRDSAVREVVILGRRGPEHAACNNPELEELGELPGVDIAVEPHGPLDCDTESPSARRKLTTLRDYATREPAGHERTLILRFRTTPTELVGSERITSIDVTTLDGTRESLDAGLILRATGYFGSPLPDLPFDAERGVIPHSAGRVMRENTPLPGTYVTGWIKRGPRGIIGSNKKCARDTVRGLLDDAAAGLLPTESTLSAAAVEQALRARVTEVVDWSGWTRIDAHELATGASTGRPRRKLTQRAALFEAARSTP